MGQLMLDGVPPYGVAANHKFPGAYLAYAAIMTCFGQTAAGIHIGMLLVNLASTMLIFFLGRKLAGNVAGLAAAAAWVVMSVSPGVYGNAGHLTHFVMLAVLGGLVLLWRALETGKAWMLWVAGTCLGVSVVVRQTSVLFVFFGLAFFWLTTRQNEKRNSRTAMIGLGAIVPLVAIAVWLWQAGVFPQFWRWTITQAAAYGSQVSVSDGIKNLLETTPKAIGWNLLIWLGMAAGTMIALSERSRRGWFLAGFLLAGVIAVIPGLYFREHYYIQVLPAVALLFGLAVERAWVARTYWRYLAVTGSIAAVLLPLIAQRSYYLEQSPTAMARYVFGANPFPEAIEIARYVEANSEPGDRIAVLGSEPEIYFYAHRRAATSLIYTYPLMERHRYAHELQETVAREIERASPKFIVVVSVSASWLETAQSDRFIFDWATSFLAREYQLDGIADILAGGSQYVWGRAAADYQVQSIYFLSVYRRVSY